MKIIASDFDGTLLHRQGNEHVISQKDRDAIKKWRAGGNLFGIVTGRGSEMPKTVVNENLDIDFVITFNGAEIYDVSTTPAKLLKRTLGQTDRLYDTLPIILRSSGSTMDIITPERRYHVTYNDEAPDSQDNWVKSEAIKAVKQFLHIQSLYESSEEALEVARQLNADFSDAVSPLVNGRWLNIPASGVTKASGVWEYAQIMSVSKENIFSIGDSYNDMDMIKAFNGFTLENGVDELKQIARAVYRGVWELIEALMR